MCALEAKCALIQTPNFTLSHTKLYVILLFYLLSFASNCGCCVSSPRLVAKNVETSLVFRRIFIYLYQQTVPGIISELRLTEWIRLLSCAAAAQPKFVGLSRIFGLYSLHSVTTECDVTDVRKSYLALTESP